MGKTILHFSNYDMTIKVARSGVTLNPYTGLAEQTIPEPRIAPSGYYKLVQVSNDTHLYYAGETYELSGDTPINCEYKQS